MCVDLDKVNNNFFWGGTEKKHKVHLCEWNAVCKPKLEGGLGFKKSADMNKTMLAKVGWRLHFNDHGLWAKMFEAKYLKGQTTLDDSLRTRQVCSSTWKNFLHGTELLVKGMRWRVGKGKYQILAR